MTPDLNLGRERAKVAERMQRRGYAPLLYAVLDNHPIGKDWQCTTRDVAARLRQHPRFNLGWRMGVQPNGRRLLGLDDDGELDRLEVVLGQLPPTWTQQTPSGGCHCVFTVPAGVQFSNRTRLAVGETAYEVDVKCDGGALCLAPSERPSGIYKVTDARPLAPLPERWITALRYVEPPPPEPLPDGVTGSLQRALAYTAHCEPAISGSGGHAATFRVATKCVEFALTIAETLHVLRVFNERCQPKWTERDLLHKAESAHGVSRVQRGGKLARSRAQDRAARKLGT